jgi:hypothetical protein
VSKHPRDGALRFVERKITTPLDYAPDIASLSIVKILQQYQWNTELDHWEWVDLPIHTLEEQHHWDEDDGR